MVLVAGEDEPNALLARGEGQMPVQRLDRGEALSVRDVHARRPHLCVAEGEAQCPIRLRAAGVDREKGTAVGKGKLVACHRRAEEPQPGAAFGTGVEDDAHRDGEGQRVATASPSGLFGPAVAAEGAAALGGGGGHARRSDEVW